MSEKPQAATSAAEHETQTRIGRRFAELRRSGELGLVAYITAGDPSLAATREIVLAAADAGADVIELGVPFTDPVADGPVIQRASERALRAGTTLAAVIDLVADLRRSTEVPLVLFSYFNPILQIGLENFARRAAQAERLAFLHHLSRLHVDAAEVAVDRLHAPGVAQLQPPVAHEDLPKILATCDVGLLPLDDHPRNREQGGPLSKLSEYLAAGRPVIQRARL